MSAGRPGTSREDPADLCGSRRCCDVNLLVLSKGRDRPALRLGRSNVETSLPKEGNRLRHRSELENNLDHTVGLGHGKAGEDGQTDDEEGAGTGREVENRISRSAKYTRRPSYRGGGSLSSKGKKSRRRSRYEISIAAIRRAYTYIIIDRRKNPGEDSTGMHPLLGLG